MIRRWLLFGLVVLCVGLALVRRDELFEAWRILVGGDARWIAVAAALQAGFYLLWATLYATSFAIVGVPARLSDTLPLLLASLSINVVVPTGGVSGAALFVDDAGLRGASRARAVAGVMLTSIADLTAVSMLLAVGLAQLARHHGLQAWETLGAAAFFAIPLGSSLLLVACAVRPVWVTALLGALSSVVRWVPSAMRREPIAPDWPSRTVAELADAARAIRARPARLTLLLAIALSMHTLSAASLGALFHAFHQQVDAAVVVTGYAFGILAWVLSPVPQGIGVVEGAIALIYSAFGVPPGAAGLTAVAFRTLTLWLPMGVGAFLLGRLRSFRGKREYPSTARG